MDVPAYLARIGYAGPRAVNARVLRDLQIAHLLTVPFENLSIHAGEPIVLDDEALFEKIVVRRRGGFCYEANGLFAALLRAIGFDVALLSASVARADGRFSPEFDHMALLVTLDEPWLVDVGFGDTFREPLRIDDRAEHVQGRQAYRIAILGGYRVLGRREGEAPWAPQYRFTLQPYDYADFASRCRWQETSPESHFTRQRICTIATPAGRMTLSDMRFIETADQGARVERELATQAEYHALLRERFGITLSPHDIGSSALGP